VRGPSGRRLVSGTLCQFLVARSFLRRFSLVVGPWTLVLASDSSERYCLGSRVCFLTLEVCLGCHVGHLILVHAHDWPDVCHLDYARSDGPFDPCDA
jgi:hypothetical protein